MSRIKIASHSFLIQNFHEFFDLLLRQKEYALRANEGTDPLTLEKQKGAEQAASTEPDNPLVLAIQRRLSLLLEDQAIHSTTQAGEFAVSSYQDTLYAMVAYADEVFLNIPWSGQKQWENNLLESRFFQTQIAGELIFEKIDELISNNDPMRADLAIVYLLILGLGFKGRYRAEGSDPDKLALYRQQLYTMVHRHPSNLYDPGREHLMEDCYDHVLDSTISQGLPEIRMWLYTFIGILGVYLFASTVLWYKLVRDMDSSLGSILQQAQQLGIS